MIVERITLVAGALVFLVIGVLFLYDPAYTALVDIELPSGAARADVRAVYGGLDLALGLFLMLAARTPGSIPPGLLALVLAFGCLAGGRLLGIALDEPDPGITGKLLTAEIIGFLWAGAALFWHHRRGRLERSGPDR